MTAASPSVPTINTISGPGALVVAGGGVVGDVTCGVAGGAVVWTFDVTAVVIAVVDSVAGRVVLKTLVGVGVAEEVMRGFVLRIWTLPV